MQNAYDCRWVPLAERAVGLPTASSPTPARTSGGVRWSACVCSGKNCGVRLCTGERVREGKRRRTSCNFVRMASTSSSVINLFILICRATVPPTVYSPTGSVVDAHVSTSIVSPKRSSCASHVQHSAVLYPTTFNPHFHFPRRWRWWRCQSMCR